MPFAVNPLRRNVGSADGVTGSRSVSFPEGPPETEAMQPVFPMPEIDEPFDFRHIHPDQTLSIGYSISQRENNRIFESFYFSEVCKGFRVCGESLAPCSRKYGSGVPPPVVREWSGVGDGDDASFRPAMEYSACGRMLATRVTRRAPALPRFTCLRSDVARPWFPRRGSG